MVPRPVGAQRLQLQAGDHSLPFGQPTERAQRGQERIGAWVKQVAITEHTQRQELRPGRTQPSRPGLFVLANLHRVSRFIDDLDARLRVVRCDLSSHQVGLFGTDQEPHPAAVCRQLKRERLIRSDRLQQVFDTQQGAFARARRGDLEEHRFSFGCSSEGVESHCEAPFFVGVVC